MLYASLQKRRTELLIMELTKRSSGRRTTTMPFEKYHGLKNDFVILDLPADPEASQLHVLTADRLRRLADRRVGVGCDQIMVVLPASQGDEVSTVTHCDARYGHSSS